MSEYDSHPIVVAVLACEGVIVLHPEPPLNLEAAVPVDPYRPFVLRQDHEHDLPYPLNPGDLDHVLGKQRP